MRIERFVAIAALLSLPATAEAQTAWRSSHTGGQPILVWTTPPLTPGQTYAFETAGAALGADLPGSGDTVATLRTSISPAGTNLGGGDGCSYRGQLRATCFTVTIPTTYTAPTSFQLIVRPYTNSMSGTTTIRIQQTATPSTTQEMCTTNPTTVQPGCWINAASNLSFGAATGYIGTAATNYHFETRERPGTQTVYQMIGFAPSAADWNIRIGSLSNHSNLVGGTVEHLGPLPSGVASSWQVFAGALYAASPIDFVRNDFGRLSPTSTFGTDSDGDGLGATLEGILWSCDGAASTYCAALNGCAVPTSQLCVASRRDSDRDGFEDNLEFYGYQNGIDNLSNMARFGANPARYDVFWEADVGDNTPEGASCTYSDEGYFDWYEAMQAAMMYATPSAGSLGGFQNPDGSSGIALHTDLAPVPAGALAGAPSNDNPSYGVWGGATCVRDPSCSSDSQCTFGGVAGVCEPVATAGARRACSSYNGLANRQTNQRRWLFRHGMTYVGASGQATNRYTFSAGGPAEAAHEIGHLGTLGHSGPAQNYYTDFNFSSLHLSTMNYGYSYLGFFDNADMTPALPSPADEAFLQPVLRAAAFSGRTSSTDPLAIAESCVFTGDEATAAELALYDFPIQRVGSCLNVDWDRDGSYLTTGQTTSAATWRGPDYRKRRRAFGGTRWLQRNSGVEVVVTGSVTRLIRNELVTPTSGGLGQLTVSTANSFVCNTLPQASASWPAIGSDRYPACDFSPAAAVGLFDGALNVSTRAFAATDIASPTGGETMLLAWLVPFTNTIRWGRMGPSAPSGQLEASGLITGAAARTTTDGTELLSLARTPTGAVLVYRTAAGSLVEQELTWSGTTAVWSAPATLSSSISTGMNGSAGLTHAYGTTSLTQGIYMAVQTGTSALKIYRRTGAATWTLASTSTTPAALQGQPVIEVGLTRPRTTGNFERLHIFARFGNNPSVMTRDSDMNAVSFSSLATREWRPFDEDGARALVTTAMARDTQRAPFGLRGVDYELVGNATVLGPQAVGPDILTCPIGSPVTAGARQVCFSSGVPVDTVGNLAVVDCGASSIPNPTPTNGGCPTSYACQVTNAGSFCTLNGFVPMREERAPSVDGIIPARIEQQNEWPQMRHGYCRTGRELRAQTFTPAGFTYPPAGLPGVTAVATCPVAPVY